MGLYLSSWNMMHLEECSNWSTRQVAWETSKANRNVNRNSLSAGICFQETFRIILNLCVTKGNYTIARGKKSWILKINQSNCTIHFHVTPPSLYSTHAQRFWEYLDQGNPLNWGHVVTKQLEVGMILRNFLPKLTQIKASLCVLYENNQKKALVIWCGGIKLAISHITSLLPKITNI